MQPIVQQRYAFNRRSYERVLTKIGLNLTAHLLGVDFARDSRFDSAVAFARFDTGYIYKYPPDKVAEIASTLGRPIINRHLFILAKVPMPDGRFAIICMIQLYNAAVECIKLAELSDAVDVLEKPIVVHVDYISNVIETLTLEEHLKATADE